MAGKRERIGNSPQADVPGSPKTCLGGTVMCLFVYAFAGEVTNESIFGRV